MRNETELYNEVAKQIERAYKNKYLLIPLVSGRLGFGNRGGICDAYEREARMFVDEPLAILEFLKNLPEDVLAAYDEVDDFLHQAVARAKEAK